MKIFLRSFGVLRHTFGTEAEAIELPAGAALRDLVEAADAHGSRSIPGHLWDHGERWFRGPVIVRIGKRVVKDPATPLQDQQEVELFKVVVGG